MTVFEHDIARIGSFFHNLYILAISKQTKNANKNIVKNNKLFGESGKRGFLYR
jgi:hypothetical protein